MRIKLLFTFSFMMLLYLTVIAKAFHVQIISHEKLMKYSNKQFYKELKTYPKRGNIFDRNGNPLAVNVKSYSLFTIPIKGQFNKWEVRKLSRMIKGINFSKLWKNLTKRKKYTWIKRKIQLDDKQLNEIKKFKTIFVDTELSRMYPNNQLASQLLGFVGLDNRGLSGLEYHFDKKLRGKEQVVKFYKDAKGRPVKYVTKRAQVQASSIDLSIDKELQAVVEKYLKFGVEKFSADHGGAAIMNAQTGELLAIANYPDFDPNNYKAYPQKNHRLSLITDSIEPGSTFKTLTIASALEHEIVTAKSSFYCELGRMKVLNHTITEAESSEKFEWLTVREILEKSSNIGTTKIAFELGAEKFLETINDYEIGIKTGIEFPGESKGIIKKKKLSSLDISNMSFGQGIAVSGIQLLRFYASIANGGYLVKPTLLKTNKDDIDKKRVLSESTVKELESMLEGVVENGTGSNAKMKGFLIAGKTSTAQRVLSSGGYDGYIPGFIGYPTTLENKYVVYTYLSNPKGNQYYGNTVAAPIFKKIVSHLLFRDKGISTIARKKSSSLDNQLDKISVRQSSLRYTNGITPNFVGWDKKSVQKFAIKNNLKIKIKGFGVVTKQSPKAGTSVTKNDLIKLHLEVPGYE